MSRPPLLRHAVSLRTLNTFGFDVQAANYLAVEGLEQLQAVRQDPALVQLPRLVLGGGSNLVLSGDVPGLVLHMTNTGIEQLPDEDGCVVLRVQAAERWHDFVQWTLAQDFGGLENLSLIPGTVGAAPIQNIGAYGSELAEFFHSLRAYDFATGEVLTLTREDCAFAYRDSVFKHALRDRAVILDVTFALPRAWQPNLRYPELVAALADLHITAPSAIDISNAVMGIRRRKLPDPAVVGNAGSFFKNPVVSATQCAQIRAAHPQLVAYPQPDGQVKLAAGWLIDQCGWKGRAHARAGVHEHQALVLINRGGATGEEVLELAARIREDVAQRFGVMLEMEPVVV